jgi:hypothetical protein
VWRASPVHGLMIGAGDLRRHEAVALSGPRRQS